MKNYSGQSLNYLKINLAEKQVIKFIIVTDFGKPFLRGKPFPGRKALH